MLHPWSFTRHNVDNFASEVVGQNWSSESDLSFLGGLGGRASGIELSLDLFAPRHEGCVYGELRVSGFSSRLVVRSAKEVLLWNCHSSEAFLSPCNEGEGLVREMKVVRSQRVQTQRSRNGRALHFRQHSSNR